MNFNPRSREGSDRDVKNFFLISLYFNPRSREGSDDFGRVGQIIGADFNPRSREGSDFMDVETLPPVAISIHAPARGATLSFRST